MRHVSKQHRSQFKWVDNSSKTYNPLLTICHASLTRFTCPLYMPKAGRKSARELLRHQSSAEIDIDYIVGKL